MKLFATTTIVLTLAAGTAAAAEATEKDAIAMTERAAALIKTSGKEELMKRITAKDHDFVQGSTYVYVRDFNTGINLAHPFNPSIVGKNLDEVPDTNGKLYRRDILELAKKDGKGWVDYQYKNPTNGKMEPKTVYVLRVGDVILVTGIYKK
jgi:cytochrome c